MRGSPLRQAAKSVALIAATMAITMCATQVIAASPPIDHAAAPLGSPESPRPAALDVTSIALLLLAAAALGLIFVLRWHRLARTPARPRAFPPLAGLFLAAATLLLGSVGLSLGKLFGMRITPEAGGTLTLAEVAKVVLIASASRMLGVVVYAAALSRAAPPRPERRVPRFRAVAMGIAALLLTWPLVSAALIIAGWLLRVPPESIAHDTLQQLKDAPVDAWFMIIIACVMFAAPVIEEVMYRGLIQQAARQTGFSPWSAIAMTSGVFALAHAEVVRPYALVGLFVLSLGFGWAYEKTGRLLAPIVMHVLFNAGNLLLARMTTA